MKTTASVFLIALSILMQNCKSTECPPDPLSANDIAGYIDGSTGILFTTTTNKENVLTSLNATPHEEGTYKMPVFEIDEQQVYLVFRTAEVEQPFQYIDYRFSDYCYNSIFLDFENELMELIELNEENMTAQFIIACGDVVGQLDDNEKEKEKNIKGKEKEALENLKKKEENKRELKKELSEMAKKKGDEAKQALNNDDKEGAKEKAKELVDETKFRFNLKYNYDFCDEWNLKLDYGFYWTADTTVIPPDLINEFSNANIRYKVYKNAECGPGPPTIGFTCFQFTPFLFDSIRPPPPPPAIWTTQEHQFRDVCQRGKGFCVEQEVVILIEKDYSDSLCTRLVNVRPINGFACFK